ncbi:alpha/beta hydrolase [Streptomyces sp. NPDC055400]
MPRIGRRSFLIGATATVGAVTLGRTPAQAQTPAHAKTHAKAQATIGDARVVAEDRIDARTLDLTIDSPSLADPAAKVRLLLPQGWTPNPTRTWPVLYLLHGAGDDYTSWTRSTDVTTLTQDTGVLVVMPTGGRAGFYSDWWNHGVDGPPRWENFHLVELLRILETGYGAGPQRAIAGLSMGGLGTMAYAARHPGLFRAAASFSGVVYPTYTGPHDPSPFDGPALVQGTVQLEGYDPDALWGDPAVDPGRWAAHSPADLAFALKDIPLFVSSGNGQPGPFEPPGTPADPNIEPLMEIMGKAFVERLQQAGAHVTTDFYGPGIHNWPYWERELHRSYALLMNAIAA